MKKQDCIICRKPLINGIIINGRGICECCEERLMNIDMGTDFYKHYINCIKRYIVVPMLRGEDNNCRTYHL